METVRKNKNIKKFGISPNLRSLEKNIRRTYGDVMADALGVITQKDRDEVNREFELQIKLVKQLQESEARLEGKFAIMRTKYSN